ncbi:hypothetical protein NHX12_006050, partial [Muraenolepis orangiensis]
DWAYPMRREMQDIEANFIKPNFQHTFRDAFSHVQERRFCINPNVGFVHQLQAGVTEKGELSSDGRVMFWRAGGRKRSLEEDEDLGGMQVTAAQNG